MTSLNPSGAPPESKTVAQFVVAWVTGAVTWVLTTYVFKGSLPPQLATFLPYVIPTGLGLVAGYFARHTPRLDDVVQEAEAQLQKYLAAQPAPAGSAVRFSSPSGTAGSGTTGVAP